MMYMSRCSKYWRFMINEQKEKIRQLRMKGVGYTGIANELGLSKETVKSFCRRNGLAGRAEKICLDWKESDGKVCRNCGRKLQQISGKKTRIFCSQECREQWWKENPEKIKKKAIYEYACAYCGKKFKVYGNKHRKYCSHDCYITDRFGRNPEKNTMADDTTAQNTVIKQQENLNRNIGISNQTMQSKMSEEEFHKELCYHISLSMAKSMLEKGIIGDEEYKIIDAELLKMYQPLISSLIAGIAVEKPSDM